MPTIITETFKAEKAKVIPFNTQRISSSPIPKQIERDIIDLEIKQEDSIMSQDTYTKSEVDLKFDKINSDIQHGFEKVDLKFENMEQKMEDNFKQVDLKFERLEQKMDYGFKQVDLKFDNFERRIENLFLSQENKRLEEQAKTRREFMYWAIGILVALAGIAIPIWFGK